MSAPKYTPPNPLPCGCGAKGWPELDHGEVRERYTGIHVAFCPLHAAAPQLVEALETIEAGLYSEWIRKDGSGLHLETYLQIASRAVIGAGGNSIYAHAALRDAGVEP